MTSPKHPPGASAPTDRDVQALLERHRCPMPLHALRTLFLGAIASPRLAVSPMALVAQAWGGELPEFASSEEAEEVMRVLVQGLWNRLAEHQHIRNPFRLTRIEVGASRAALLDLVRMRAKELNGFVDGLLGTEDEMLLPQKAHDAIETLAELYAMFNGAAGLLADESKPAPPHELKALLRNLQQMTLSADALINKVVQSCKRARSLHLETMATVMSRRFGAAAAGGGEVQEETDSDEDDEPDFIESPLSQSVTRHGVTVRIEIYADPDGAWILEVIDAEHTSHVWDEQFETDQQALDEALRALEEEPLEFLGRAANRPMN